MINHHTPHRMKYPTLLAFALALAAIGVPVARATTIHSGSFTADIASTSTMGWSFSGDYASFSMGPSPYHSEHVASRFFGSYPDFSFHLEQTRTLSAQLQADAGKIFDKVYVGLTPGGISNQRSGATSQSNWTVGGGSWVGNTSYYFDNGWASFHDWNITSPNSGESTYYDEYWFREQLLTWGGFWGTPEYLTGYYNVGAASLSLDLLIYAYINNYPGDRFGASFDPPGLVFQFTYLDAPPESVPDRGGLAVCLMTALLGLGAAKRRLGARESAG